MEKKLYRLLFLICTLLLIFMPDAAFTANYQWIQDDWQLGPSTLEFSGHDDLQNGRQDWEKFFSGDDTIELITQGFTISNIPAVRIDTDFLNPFSIKTNLVVVGGALKIKPFLFNEGSGADGSLVIDGKTPGNSTLNGAPLGQNYPRIVEAPANLTSAVARGGSLTPGSTYSYMVAAYNQVGESTPANTTRTSSSTFRSIVLSWNAVKCADGYRIYRMSSSGPVGLLANVPGENTTTYTDNGATNPDTNYQPAGTNTSDGAFVVTGGENYLDVAIQNCGGISSPAGVLLSTPTGVAVSLVSGSGPGGTHSYIVTAVGSTGLETNRSTERSINGSSSVQVSWSPVTGASGYRVYRRLQSGTYTSSSLLCTTTTATTCTDSGAPLSAGAPPVNSVAPIPLAAASSTGGQMSNGTYYYVLTAIDFSGIETTPGSQRSVVVPAGTSANSVNLSWTAVSDAYGYRVYRTTISGRFNSPALVCTINDPSVRTCIDTLSQPLEGGPPSKYFNALAGGALNLRVSDNLSILSKSAIYMSKKGYAGGDSEAGFSTPGLTGSGPGAGFIRGAGAGYGTIGMNNTGNTGYPGNPYGDKLITRLYAGSGGASGSAAGYEGITGKGGKGGGAMNIMAGRIILDDGDLLSDGEAGGNGSGRYGNGGGGASGGSIIIGGYDIELISGNVSALGGKGGTSSPTFNNYSRGGSGGSGRIRIAIFDSLLNYDSNTTIAPVPVTGNEGTYESVSFELDNSVVSFDTLSWDADVPSSGTLKFQIATNSDNKAWNFKGPDGSKDSFYSISSPECTPSGTRTECTIPANIGHTGHRYFKYMAYLTAQTINPDNSPALREVAVNFRRTKPVQSLVSSPYDSAEPGNAINRLQWSENLQAGTNAVVQLRTSPSPGINFDQWRPWFGPNRTTFTASSGVTIISVADASRFTAGRVVTLYDSTITPSNRSSRCIAPPDEHDGLEVRKINAINGNAITLNSGINCSYSSGSVLTDTYTDPAGSEPIIQDHRIGSDDQWLQYKVYLLSDNSKSIPTFSGITIGYQRADVSYKPDGIIMSSGGDIYGGAGSGGGGDASITTNPASHGGMAAFPIEVQNDGSPVPDPQGRATDTYEFSWTPPAPDTVGGQLQPWPVVLCGFTDYSSDSVCNTPLSSGFITGPIPVNSSETYYLLVTPSLNAPAGSSKNIIVDIRSTNDYSKIDSLRAAVNINTVYQGDGVIQTIGSGVYDPCASDPDITCSGAGGMHQQTANSPGEEKTYNVVLWNRGNIADAYKLSLSQSPPPGWTVIVNGGSGDYNITDPAVSWATPSIGSTANIPIILKIIPKGAPVTHDVILNIYSNGANRYADSLTARLTLSSGRKVDGIIYGFGYDADGVIRDYTLPGSSCGTTGSGDNIYGAAGSGNGGCTVMEVPAGSSRVITVGVQNEGNIPDRYELSWNTPADLTIALVENASLSSSFQAPQGLAGNPPAAGLCDSGFVCYNPGELPFFSFHVTASGTFSGSRTVIFNIKSLEDTTKVDSLRAIINSRDAIPPDPADLSTGNPTSTSIVVSWNAPGDDGSTGTAASFDLRYSESPITTDAGFAKAAKVRACKSGESIPGKPRAAGSPESCTVTPLFADTNYYFALKTSDESGNTSSLSSCGNCPARTLVSGDSINPGAVTDLVVSDHGGDTFTLCWTAPADDGASASSGSVTGYDLRYTTRSIVDDGAAAGVGQVSFSNANAVVPLDGWQPPKSPGTKECYIVPVENIIDTAKDIDGVDITDNRTRNTRFYFSIKALDEARNKSGTSNLAGGVTSLIPYAYNMVSVPYVPSPSAPVSVFGDDVGTPLYTYWWDSRGPNIGNGCYDGEPGPFSEDPAFIDGSNPAETYGDDMCSRLFTIKEGHGYVLWAPSGNNTLDVPAGSAQSPTQNCTDDTGTSFQCYVFPLQEGWNLIGNPFDREINFTSRDTGGVVERGLYVRRTGPQGVSVATFEDAVTSRNWLDGSIYSYNGVNYTYEECRRIQGEPVGTGCSPVMQPWKAYWIRMHVLGGAAFDLLIPK